MKRRAWVFHTTISNANSKTLANMPSKFAIQVLKYHLIERTIVISIIIICTQMPLQNLQISYYRIILKTSKTTIPFWKEIRCITSPAFFPWRRELRRLRTAWWGFPVIRMMSNSYKCNSNNSWCTASKTYRTQGSMTSTNWQKRSLQGKARNI